jgi:DNA-binding NarL/FixJ family response regulator
LAKTGWSSDSTFSRARPSCRPIASSERPSATSEAGALVRAQCNQWSFSAWRSALDPHVVASLVSVRGEDDRLADLTEREREVLELMAEGLTNAGIAKRPYLSERTVEAHVRHVLMKLNMPESEDGHRRVLAVLAHLGATQNK